MAFLGDDGRRHVHYGGFTVLQPFATDSLTSRVMEIFPWWASALVLADTAENAMAVPARGAAPRPSVGAPRMR